MEPTEGGTRLIDSVTYDLPGGTFGKLGHGVVERMLERMFWYRHERTRMDVVTHAQSRATGPLRVGRVGGYGIGGGLTGGVSGRRGAPGGAAGTGEGGPRGGRAGLWGPGVGGPARSREAGVVAWDPRSGWVEPGGLEGLDVLVHLAGAGVGEGRWTPGAEEGDSGEPRGGHQDAGSGPGSSGQAAQGVDLCFGFGVLWPARRRVGG